MEFRLVLLRSTELQLQVFSASECEARALLVAETTRVDLLLTYVGLPGLNGRQLADIAQESLPGLKVLFMTGYAENVVDGSEFQGVGLEVILKPFSLDDLMRRIREMLKQPAAGGAALMDAAKLDKLTPSSGQQDAEGAGLQ